MIDARMKFGRRWLVKVNIFGIKPIMFPKKIVEKIADANGIKNPAFLPEQLITISEMNS